MLGAGGGSPQLSLSLLILNSLLFCVRNFKTGIFAAGSMYADTLQYAVAITPAIAALPVWYFNGRWQCARQRGRGDS